MTLFILVPALTPDGPIKGAIALANAAVKHREVYLVSIKRAEGAMAIISEKVKTVCLADKANSAWGKIRAYRDLVSFKARGNQCVSISMCFSADVLNLFIRNEVKVACSVRGNLVKNYRYEYGLIGALLGAFHLSILRYFDLVVAMNQVMADQVRFYARISPHIVKNFVDEEPLESSRSPHKPSDLDIFVFVGSLTRRKKIDALIAAAENLKQRGVRFRLEILGQGELYDELTKSISSKELEGYVKLHGFVEMPFKVVTKASALVLPSLSEGTPRAVLEALYLGIPCVLRDVDGNSELITDGLNGALFTHDDELAEAMLNAARVGRGRLDSQVLLPIEFRQAHSVNRTLQLLDSL